MCATMPMSPLPHMCYYLLFLHERMGQKDLVLVHYLAAGTSTAGAAALHAVHCREPVLSTVQECLMVGSCMYVHLCACMLRYAAPTLR